MKESLSKHDITDVVSKILNKERIVIGGNKVNYKKKYHLKYSKEIIKTVLEAYYQALTDAISNGDSVVIYDRFKLSPKYHKERIVRDNTKGGTLHILHPRYKVSFRAFSKLEKACEDLLTKKPNGLES